MSEAPVNPRVAGVLAAVGSVLVVGSIVAFSSIPGIAGLVCTVGVLVLFAGLGSLSVGVALPEALSRKWVVFGGTLTYWLLVDQASKAATARLRPGIDEIPVIPGWLSIVHAQNFGAAFSSLEGQFWVFIVFACVASVIVLDLMRRMKPDQAFMAGTLGMILSGAWGNSLDRLRIGHVTDFIRVYTDAPGLKAWFIQNFGTNTWPIFNVADSVLLVGVSLFLVHYLFLEEEEGNVDVDDALAEERS